MNWRGMGYIERHLPEFIVAFAGTLVVLIALARFWRKPSFANPKKRIIILAVSAILIGIMFGGPMLRSARLQMMLPGGFKTWAGAAAFMLTLVVLISAVAGVVLRLIPRVKPEHSPSRRLFLNTARQAVLVAPAAVAGYGVFIQRSSLRAAEVTIPIAGLAPELNGLRLVQVSDVHLSPFLSEQELARAVDMANEFKAHVALVTGDLITIAGDPLDAAIRQVGRLRAEAGVLGCHGNHEVYAGVEDYATQEAARYGIRFLRSETATFEFGGKPLNFAGVDYQRMGSEYLEGAETMVKAGMPNILLSHNPDVFPLAAEKGFDSTIAGHTHGGQITVEILHQNLSVARFYTPYVYGLYQKGKSSIYVTRGVGTVGIPARLGAPPEIAYIKLCAT